MFHMLPSCEERIEGADRKRVLMVQFVSTKAQALELTTPMLPVTVDGWATILVAGAEM